MAYSPLYALLLQNQPDYVAHALSTHTILFAIQSASVVLGVRIGMGVSFSSLLLALPSSSRHSDGCMGGKAKYGLMLSS
jgi:ABC-type multidrug transport system permease subunit